MSGHLCTCGTIPWDHTGHPHVVIPRMQTDPTRFHASPWEVHLEAMGAAVVRGRVTRETYLVPNLSTGRMEPLIYTTEKETRTMTTPTPLEAAQAELQASARRTVKLRAKLNRAMAAERIAALAVKSAAILPEPAPGSVVKFNVQHELRGTNYSYAAIRAGARWFTTGSTCPRAGYSWGQLNNLASSGATPSNLVVL